MSMSHEMHDETLELILEIKFEINQFLKLSLRSTIYKYVPAAFDGCVQNHYRYDHDAVQRSIGSKVDGPKSRKLKL